MEDCSHWLVPVCVQFCPQVQGRSSGRTLRKRSFKCNDYQYVGRVVGHPTYPTRVQVHRSRLAVVRAGSCTSGTDRQLTVTLISSVCKYLQISSNIYTVSSISSLDDKTGWWQLAVCSWHLVTGGGRVWHNQSRVSVSGHQNRERLCDRDVYYRNMYILRKINCQKKLSITITRC